MSSRTVQIAVAGVSVAVMIYVLIAYGLRDAPPASRAGEPHVGTQHHTAEPHEGSAAAPLQPFETAQVGAWVAHESTTTLTNMRPTVTSILTTIESVDGTVGLVRSQRDATLVPPSITRERRPRTGLSIDELAGNRASEWTLHGLVITDEVRAVGGRLFPCKKLAFELINPLDRSRRGHVEMWLSAEVPVDGIVEVRQRIETPALQRTTVVVGFGTAEAITWGKKLDGL